MPPRKNKTPRKTANETYLESSIVEIGAEVVDKKPEEQIEKAKKPPPKRRVLKVIKPKALIEEPPKPDLEAIEKMLCEFFTALLSVFSASN